MGSKNIVVAPCGNKSHLFHDAWLKDKAQRNFDICLLFYHENIDNPDKYKEVDFFYHLRDFKYHMLYELFTKIHPEWLEQYDYFYFLDDDIYIETKEINQMFLLSQSMGSWISQASLTNDSFCSWPMFKQKKNSFCRFVGQIEVMAPLFNSDSLRKCLPSFIGNKSSWGVDSVWSKILDYPQNKLIVFDIVTMRHTLPVGGGELYQKIKTPHEEWEKITKAFGARKHNYQEYGRLQLVNSGNNRINFFIYKSGEFFNKIKQSWNDYDLMSRVNSRLGKLFGKKAL